MPIGSAHPCAFGLTLLISAAAATRVAAADLQALEQCSCSIDVIASILPYERYVAAETVLSLSQVPGRFGTMFQSPEQAKTATNDLRRAQAEAGVRCF
jgi:hypothetical protein